MVNSTGIRIADRIKKLSGFFKKEENILFAFLFGLQVRREGKRKDLDIAIYFHNPLRGFELLNFINALSDLAGKEVDLVVLNEASAFLRHQVIKQGVPLVIKDSTAYRLFRERTISDYDEYKFISGMNKYD